MISPDRIEIAPAGSARGRLCDKPVTHGEHQAGDYPAQLRITPIPFLCFSVGSAACGSTDRPLRCGTDGQPADPERRA